MYRGDTLIYSENKIERLDKLNIDNNIFNNDGITQKIKNINTSKINNYLYKIKINNTVDNTFLDKNTNILSIQNIPHDIKNSDIPNYIEDNQRNCKISFNNIKNLTDFDYIGYPILKFNNDLIDENIEYYRFYGISMINNYYNKIILTDDKNKNTIAFLNKYLFNNNIKYDINHINVKQEITFEYDYDKNINLNLNEECSKQLLKGLIELYYIKNNDEPYLNIKIVSKELIYIFKFLLLKFGILLNILYNNLDSYFIIKIPKVGIIAELFNITLDYNDYLNYFKYNNYLWIKIRSIKKINKYNGVLYNINTENNNILTECGIISRLPSN